MGNIPQISNALDMEIRYRLLYSGNGLVDKLSDKCEKARGRKNKLIAKGRAKLLPDSPGIVLCESHYVIFKKHKFGYQPDTLFFPTFITEKELLSLELIFAQV